MRPRSQRDCLAIDEFVLAAGARDRFRADHVGVVFQMFNLLPYLSARDNILRALPTSSSTLCRTTIREFLLVPYFGACVHMPPPPANQLIHVIPDQPIAAGLNMSPVWVNGVLNVGRVASELGSAGYQMRAMKVEAYTEPLPR